MRIDITRYAEDKACATPEGLKERLLRELSPQLEKIYLQRNRCLVATYVRPNVSSGGIIFTDKKTEEDRWQGKVGLLLKTGPAAFEFDEVMEQIQSYLTGGGPDGAPIETSESAARYRAYRDLGVPFVGDWIAYRTSETHEVGIEVEKGICASCRFITDDSIIMRVADPSIIW